jgi:hypothetical protein
MTEQETLDLEVGDVVKHAPTGFTFVVLNTADDAPQVVTSIHIEHPDEWERVEKDS